jgi:hypothetical protein
VRWKSKDRLRWWFAWYPVNWNGAEWVWLEWVQRRRGISRDDWGQWHYRVAVRKRTPDEATGATSK